MPLAEAAARKLGFGFQTINERNFSEKFLRNARFLNSYYHHPELSPPARDEEISAIKAQVRANPGIKITELEHESMERRAELVHLMLVKGEIFAHLSLELLTEPNRVALYPTAIQEKALELLYSKNPPGQNAALPYILEKGVTFARGTKIFTVLDVGQHVTLCDSRNVVSKLSYTAFLDWVPTISAFVDAKLTKEERLLKLTQKEYDELMRRRTIVLPFLPEAPAKIKSLRGPTQRKAQRYLKAWRESEQISPGYGICGLIPRISERGRHFPKLPEWAFNAMRHVIVKHYLQSNPRLTIQDAYHLLCEMLQRYARLKHVRREIPSYTTFVRECRKWDAAHADRIRWGKRIAQLNYVPKAIRSPLGNPHGDRPFTIAHIDHTPSDVALKTPDKAKRLNKANHSVMADATTDKSLGWATRFDGPNTCTLVQILRHCVDRNGCLPDMIIVDWGADFRSAWLQKTLATLGVTLEYRMKGNGRAGTTIEGKFRGKDVRQNHRMEGSTEVLKRARLATKAVQPLQNALWTLQDYAEACDNYHERFNATPYAKNKQSPNEREAELCRIFGAHPRGVIAKEIYHRALLPFVDRNTRKVDRRCRIYVKGHYYANSELRPVIGERVEVRQESTKVMIVTHPGLPRSVKCDAVGNALKYALTEPEAHALVAEMALPAPDVKAAKRRSWQQGAAERTATEAALHSAQKKAAKKERKPPEKPRELPDNILPFTHTADALVDLRGTEGDL